MSFLTGFILGAALGYGGAWARANPDKFREKWHELKALFEKKAP